MNSSLKFHLLFRTKNNNGLLFTDVQTVSMEETDTDTSFVRPQISQDEAVYSEPVSIPSSSPDLRSWTKFGDSEELLVTSEPLDELATPLQHIPLQVVDPVSIDHLPDGTEVLRKRSEQLDEVKDNGRRIKTIILRTYHKTVCTETVTLYEIILPRKTERLVGTTVEEHITDMAPGVDETMTEGVRKIHSRQEFDKEILPDGTWLKRSVSLTIIDPLSPHEENKPQIDSISLPGELETREDETEVKPNAIKARKVLRTVVSRVDKTTAVEETSIVKVPSREAPDVTSGEAPIQPSLVGDEDGLVPSTGSSDSGFEMVSQDFIAEQQTERDDIVDQVPETADGVPLSADAVMVMSKPVDELEILLRDATEDSGKMTDLREPDKALAKENAPDITDTVALPSPISDEQSFVFVSEETDSVPPSKKEIEYKEPFDSSTKPSGSVPDGQVNLGKKKQPETDSEVRLPEARKTGYFFAPLEQSVMEDITNLDRILQADETDVHYKEPVILTPGSVKYHDGTRTPEDVIGVAQDTVEPVDKLKKSADQPPDGVAEVTAVADADKQEIMENVMSFDQFLLPDEQIAKASYKQVPAQENGDVQTSVDGVKIDQRYEVWDQPQFVASVEISDTRQYYDGTRRLEDVIEVVPKTTIPETTRFDGFVHDDSRQVPELKELPQEAMNLDMAETLGGLRFHESPEVVKPPRTDLAADEHIVEDVTAFEQFAIPTEQPLEIPASEVTPPYDDQVPSMDLHKHKLEKVPQEMKKLDITGPLVSKDVDKEQVTLGEPDVLSERDTAVNVQYFDGTRKLENVIDIAQQPGVTEIKATDVTPRFGDGLVHDDSLQVPELQELPPGAMNLDIAEALGALRFEETPEVLTLPSADFATDEQVVKDVAAFDQLVFPTEKTLEIPATDETPRFDGTIPYDDQQKPEPEEVPQEMTSMDITGPLVATYVDRQHPQQVTVGEPDVLQQTETAISVQYFDGTRKLEDVIDIVQQPDATDIKTTDVTPPFDGRVRDGSLPVPELKQLSPEAMNLDMAEALGGLQFEESFEVVTLPTADLATHEQVVKDVSAFEQLAFSADQTLEMSATEEIPRFDGKVTYSDLQKQEPENVSQDMKTLDITGPLVGKDIDKEQVLVDEPHVVQERETPVSVQYFDGTRKLEDVIDMVQQPDAAEIKTTDVTPPFDGLVHDDSLQIPELQEVPPEAMNLDMAETLRELRFEESPEVVTLPRADLSTDEQVLEDVKALDRLVFPTDQTLEIPATEDTPGFDGKVPYDDLQKEDVEKVSQKMKTLDITGPLVGKDADKEQVIAEKPDVVQERETAVSVQYFDGTPELEDVIDIVQQPDAAEIKTTDATPRFDGLVRDDSLQIPQLQELPPEAMNLDMAETLGALRFEETPEVLTLPSADLTADEQIVKDVTAFDQLVFPSEKTLEIPATVETPLVEGTIPYDDLQKQEPENVPHEMMTIDITGPLVGKDVDKQHPQQVTVGEPDVLQPRETAISVQYFDGTRKLDDVIDIVQQPDATETKATGVTPPFDALVHDESLQIPQLQELSPEAMNLDMAETLGERRFEESPEVVSLPRVDSTTDEKVVKDVTAFDQLVFATGQTIEIPATEETPQFDGTVAYDYLQKQEPEKVSQEMSPMDITEPLIGKDVDKEQVLVDEPIVLQERETAVSVQYFDGARKLEDVIDIVQQPDATEIKTTDAKPRFDGLVRDDSLQIPQLQELPPEAMNLDMAETLGALRFEETPEVLTLPSADLTADEQIVKDVTAFDQLVFPTDQTLEIPATEETPRVEGTIPYDDLQKQEPEIVPQEMPTMDITGPLVGKDVDKEQVLVDEPIVLQERETAVSIQYFDGTRKLEDVIDIVQQPDTTEVGSIGVTPPFDGVQIPKQQDHPPRAMNLDMAETLGELRFEESTEVVALPRVDLATDEQVVKDVTAFDQLVCPTEQTLEIPATEETFRFDGTIAYDNPQKPEPEKVSQKMTTMDITEPLIGKDVHKEQVLVDKPDVLQERETSVSVHYFDGTRELEDVIDIVQQPDTTETEATVLAPSFDGLVHDDSPQIPKLQELTPKSMNLDMAETLGELRFEESPEVVALPSADLATHEQVVKDVSAFEQLVFPTEYTLEIPATEETPRVDGTIPYDDLQKPEPENVQQEMTTMDITGPLVGKDVDKEQVLVGEPDVLQERETAVCVQYFDGTRKLEDVIDDVVTPDHTASLSLTVHSVDITSAPDEAQLLTDSTPGLASMLVVSEPKMQMTTSDVEKEPKETFVSDSVDSTLPEVVVSLPEQTVEVGAAVTDVAHSDLQKPVDVRAALTEIVAPLTGPTVDVGAAVTEPAFDKTKVADVEAVLTETDVPALEQTLKDRTVPNETSNMELQRVANIEAAVKEMVICEPARVVAGEVVSEPGSEAAEQQPADRIILPSVDAQIDLTSEKQQEPSKSVNVLDTVLIMEPSEITTELCEQRKEDVTLSTPQMTVTPVKCPREDFYPEEIPSTGSSVEEPVSVELSIQADIVTEMRDVMNAVGPDAIALKESPLVGEEMTAVEQLPKEGLAADDVLDDKAPKEVLILAERLCDEVMTQTLEDLQNSLLEEQLPKTGKAIDVAEEQVTAEEPTTGDIEVVSTVNEPVEIEVDSEELVRNIAELDRLLQPQPMQLPWLETVGKDKLIAEDEFAFIGREEQPVHVDVFDGTRSLEDVLGEQEELEYPDPDAVPDHSVPMQSVAVPREMYIKELPVTDVAVSEEDILVSMTSLADGTAIAKPVNVEADDRLINEAEKQVPVISMEETSDSDVQVVPVVCISSLEHYDDEYKSPLLSADSELDTGVIDELLDEALEKIDYESTAEATAHIAPVEEPKAEKARTETSVPSVVLSDYMVKQHDITAVDIVQNVIEPDQLRTATIDQEVSDFPVESLHLQCGDMQVVESLPEDEYETLKELTTSQMATEQPVKKERQMPQILTKQFTMETCEFELYQQPSELIVEEEYSSHVELAHSPAVNATDIDVTDMVVADNTEITISPFKPIDESRDISMLYASIETTIEPMIHVNRAEIEQETETKRPKMIKQETMEAYDDEISFKIHETIVEEPWEIAEVHAVDDNQELEFERQPHETVPIAQSADREIAEVFASVGSTTRTTEPVITTEEPEIDSTLTEEVPTQAEQPVIHDVMADNLTRQITSETYELEHPQQTTDLVMVGATDKAVVDTTGVSTAEHSFALPMAETRDIQFIGTTSVDICADVETRERVEKDAEPDEKTVEIKLTEEILAAPEEPQGKERPVTEVITETYECDLRPPTVEVVTAGPVETTIESVVTAEDRVLALKPTEVISQPPEEPTPPEKLAERYAIETHEFEQPPQTTEMVTIGASEKAVAETAAIGAAELEFVLPSAESTQMQFIETTSVDVPAEGERDAQLVETLAAPEVTVVQERPLADILTKDVITETVEVELRPETSEVMTAKEPSPEIGIADTAGMTDVGIDVSVPITEGGKMQLDEAVAAVGTTETISEAVLASEEPTTELEPAEEISPPVEQPTVEDVSVSETLTGQPTIEAYEAELPPLTNEIVTVSVSEEPVVDREGVTTEGVEFVLPAGERTEMQFIETSIVDVSEVVEPAVEFEKAVIPDKITGEFKIPEETTAASEEPGKEELPVTEITAETYDRELRPQGVDVVTGGPEEKPMEPVVAAKESIMEMKATEQVSSTDEEPIDDDIVVSANLTRRYTIEMYEFELEVPSQTTEMVTVDAPEQAVGIDTAEFEFVLPTAETREMQVVVTTSVDMSAEDEPEQKLEKTVIVDETAVEKKLLEETLVALDASVEDERPLADIMMKDVVTDTADVELRPETFEVVTAKELSPEMEIADSSGVSDVRIEVSVPIVEGGEMQFVEAVAPVGTKETIAEAVLAIEKPAIELEPAEEISPPVDQSTVEEVLMSETPTGQPTIEAYEAELPPLTTERVTVIVADKPVVDRESAATEEVEFVLPAAESVEMQFIETSSVDVSGELEHAVEFEKAVVPDKITDEFELPQETITAAPEEPVEEERPVTEITGETYERELRPQGVEFVAAVPEEKTIEPVVATEESMMEIKLTEEVSSADEEPIDENILMSAKNLTRRYTIETYEFQLEVPPQTTEMVTVDAPQKAVGTDTAEFEFVLPTAETREMQVVENTSVDMSAEAEPEEKLEKAVIADETTVEIKLSEETLVAQDVTEEDERPLAEIVTNDVVTDGTEVELRPETSELVTLKEASPEMEMINVSVPIAEGGEMQFVEAAAPAGTRETIADAVLAPEEPVIEIPVTPKAPVVEERIVTAITTETYEREQRPQAVEVVTVGIAETIVEPVAPADARERITEAVLATGESIIETAPAEEVSPPVEDVLAKDVMTETADVELRPETYELVTAKEPSPEMEIIDTAGVTDVRIEVSVPIVEGGKMQFVEAVALVDTRETITEAVPATEEPPVSEIAPAEEISPPVEQPTLEDDLVSEPLTEQPTIEAYEAELPPLTTEVVTVGVSEKAVIKSEGITTEEREFVLPTAESRETQFIETTTVDVSAEGVLADEFEETIVPDKITVELEVPEELTAAAEEPVVEEQPVTEITTETYERELRRQTIDVVTASPEGTPVEEEEREVEMKPVEEVSPPPVEPTLEDVVVSEKLLSRQYTIETCEFELPPKTTEMVTVGAPEKPVAETAGIGTAELEFVLPAAESREMQFIQITPLDVSTTVEPEEKLEKAVVAEEETVELKLPEEILAEPEMAVKEARPVSDVLAKDVMTETAEVELRPESSELVTAKEPSPEMDICDTAGVTDVRIEVSVPIVEGGEMQFVEAVAPVDTRETITEAVPATEEPLSEMAPVEDISPPVEQPTVKDVLVSEPLTEQPTIEAYEAELPQLTTEIVTVGVSETVVIESEGITTEESEFVLPAAESRLTQFIETTTVDVSEEGVLAVEFQETVMPDKMTVEQEVPEELTAAAEEPVKEEQRVTEITTETYEGELRAQTIDVVTAGPVETPVEPVVAEEEREVDMKPVEEVSPTPVEPTLEDVIVSEQLLSRQHTIETYEFELPPKTTEIVTVGAPEKPVAETASIGTAELEFVLPAAESREMQFIQITPLDVSTAVGPEEKLEKAVVAEEETVQLKLPEEILAEPEMAVEEARPVSDVLAKDVMTETAEVELRPETSELVTAKEPSPEMDICDTAGVTDARIEVSVPIVEGGEMQFVEAVAPVDTRETITKRFRQQRSR